uniref:Uncharacterized protein n=1 Tax=Neobodo designis TaxID=312471 RepID=A0A7S1QQM6_NEODS
MACAQRHGVAVVDLDWIQRVIDTGLPPPPRDRGAERAAAVALAIADAAVLSDDTPGPAPAAHAAGAAADRLPTPAARAAAEPAEMLGGGGVSNGPYGSGGSPVRLSFAGELGESPAVRTPLKPALHVVPADTEAGSPGVGAALESPLQPATARSLGAVSHDSAAEVASLEATVLRPDGTLVHTPISTGGISSGRRLKSHRRESSASLAMGAVVGALTRSRALEVRAQLQAPPAANTTATPHTSSSRDAGSMPEDAVGAESIGARTRRRRRRGRRRGSGGANGTS